MATSAAPEPPTNEVTCVAVFGPPRAATPADQRDALIGQEAEHEPSPARARSKTPGARRPIARSPVAINRQASGPGTLVAPAASRLPAASRRSSHDCRTRRARKAPRQADRSRRDMRATGTPRWRDQRTNAGAHQDAESRHAGGQLVAQREASSWRRILRRRARIRLCLHRVDIARAVSSGMLRESAIAFRCCPAAAGMVERAFVARQRPVGR